MLQPAHNLKMTQLFSEAGDAAKLLQDIGSMTQDPFFHKHKYQIRIDAHVVTQLQEHDKSMFYLILGLAGYTWKLEDKDFYVYW